MNRESRSPGPLSPRMRPGGPRSRRPNPSGVKPSTPLGTNDISDESAPAYSGRNSPAVSSHAGSTSSPTAASFDRLAEVLHEAAEHRSCREQGIQTDLPTPATTRSSTPAVKLIVKQPTLTPPSAVNFDSVPIAWRGMTLESAQWNMTSEQLQEIVSRAIRKTAQESFIRLLPVKTLDEELTAELERLETLKMTTQSQYRFNMHRRTMLLQSLLALSTSNSDGDCAALCSLTTQLADITSSCDRLMAELLRVSDQKAQIQRIQDVHTSSALAMALRKLNASYAKRTAELRETRETVTQLRAELGEAWAVAQEMAEEMDELENFHSGFSSDEDVDDEKRLDDSVRLAEVIGITGRAVAMKATLTHLEAARSREREYQMDRARRVVAAKKRSSLASKASLRLPKSARNSVADTMSTSSRASRKRSLNQQSKHEASPSAPPVPTAGLQIETHAVKKGAKDDSFLEIAETRPSSPTTPMNRRPQARFSRAANGSETGTSSQGVRAPAHSQQPSFDYNIPPITIHPAEDDVRSTLGRTSLGSGRRVHSMQPPARRSLDDTNGTDIRRSASDYRKFDGWPWPGMDGNGKGKTGRRQSMPLASARSSAGGTSDATSSESASVSASVAAAQYDRKTAAGAHQSANGAASPARVFSPPPSSRTSSSAAQLGHEDSSAGPPSRVFSPPSNAVGCP